MGYQLNSFLFVGVPIEYQESIDKENLLINTPYEFVVCGDHCTGNPQLQAYIALKETIQYITRGKYEMGFNSMSIDDLEEVSDQDIDGLMDFINRHQVSIIEDMWIGWYIGVFGG